MSGLVISGLELLTARTRVTRFIFTAIGAVLTILYLNYMKQEVCHDLRFYCSKRRCLFPLHGHWGNVSL